MNLLFYRRIHKTESYGRRISTVENFMKSASGQVTRDNIKNYIIGDKKGLERQEFTRLYRSVLLWNGASTIWANLNLVQNS